MITMNVTGNNIEDIKNQIAALFDAQTTAPAQDANEKPKRKSQTKTEKPETIAAKEVPDTPEAEEKSAKKKPGPKTLAERKAAREAENPVKTKQRRTKEEIAADEEREKMMLTKPISRMNVVCCWMRLKRNIPQPVSAPLAKS